MIGLNNCVTFVKTSISVHLFVFFASSPFIFIKKRLIFSDHSICVAYLGFQTLLYFEHWVFLILDNVLSCLNMDTQKKPKQDDQWEKYCLLFLPFKCVISKQYNIGGISINCQKPNHSPWQNVKVCRSHCRRDIYRFLLSLQQFFLPTHCQGKLKNSKFASAFYR